MFNQLIILVKVPPVESVNPVTSSIVIGVLILEFYFRSFSEWTNSSLKKRF